MSAGHYNIYVKVSGGHFELEDTTKCYSGGERNIKILLAFQLSTLK